MRSLSEMSSVRKANVRGNPAHGGVSTDWMELEILLLTVPIESESRDRLYPADDTVAEGREAVNQIFGLNRRRQP